MKGKFTKLALLLVAVLASVKVSAYDFYSNGLCYNITSEEDRTVEVTYEYGNIFSASEQNSNYVQGDLTIPERVIYDSKTYRVTSIGHYAFGYCSGLTSVSIPSSVTSIGGYAFFLCSGLTSVSIPSSVTSIGEGAFSACSCLTSVNIPSSVTSIGSWAFDRCSGLTSVSIPSSVTSIGDYAFYYCSALTNVSIPSSVTTIGDYAFHRCLGLTSVSIPSSVASIGSRAFAYCDKLTDIVVDAGNQNYKSIDGLLYSIDGVTLYCCPGAKTSIKIANTVTEIDRYAFGGCDLLEEIYCMMETPVETNATFANSVLMNAVLYVPTGCKAEYEAVDPWRNFFNIEEFNTTGISQVETAEDLGVTVENGSIVVENAKGRVTVYGISGAMVKSVDADGGRTEIAVPARGVYIVKVGSKAVKVRL